MLKLLPVFWLLLAVAAAADSPKKSEPPKDPDIGDRIVQAAAYDGKLWLLGAPVSKHDAFGSLVSIDLATGARTLQDKAETIAIYRGPDDLWILRGEKDSSGELIVSRWKDGKLSKFASLSLKKGDAPIAISQAGSSPLVMTSSWLNIWSSTSGDWKKVVLLNSKDAWGVSVTAASRDGKSLYVGFDRGEWGGGMIRIDLATGARTAIEKRGVGLCEGDLNSDCDPVTGLIPDPGQDNCVIASAGLSHFSTWGRVLRVCGDEVSVIYKDEHIEHYPGGDFPVSVPFFALAPSPKGFWTVSYDKIYRFENDRLAQSFDFPKLESMNGIWLSRAVPGLAVIRTDVNWGMSLSGYTPFVVSTE